MSYTPLGLDQEATNLTNLIRDARAFGLDVPKSVSDEQALYRRLAGDPLDSQRALVEAQTALAAAPVNKIDAALRGLADATVLAGAAQTVNDSVKHIALQRLRNAVYDQLRGWEAETVAKFNLVVKDYRLNDVAGDLPNLAELVSPIDLSRTQNHALQQWRDAADQLHPLWSLYTKVAHIEGHEVGPSGADDLSTNLSLAARLGQPGSFSVAQGAAGIFASISAGTSASRRYGRLAPFCVTAICGYPLQLSTSDDAARIRQAIQHPAAAAVS
jgi:hypothetical protein